MTEEEFKIPSVETHFPREKCAEGSFRTDVFIKPEEPGKPRHKVRLIWCCPRGKWNPETKRCEDSVKLHTLIREEAPPEEHSSSTCATTTDIEKLKERIDDLAMAIDEIKALMSRSRSRGERRKYDCEEILRKGACALEPHEKRAFVMCYLQKGIKEGTITDRSKGMREAWELIRKCSSI